MRHSARPWGILLVMVAIWFVLGCLIDSISIILLTVPIFAPIAMHLGFDPLAFAIMGNPCDRDRSADAAVWHSGLHREIGSAGPGCYAFGDFPRLNSVLDRVAGAGGASGGVPAIATFLPNL